MKNTQQPKQQQQQKVQLAIRVKYLHSAVSLSCKRSVHVFFLLYFCLSIVNEFLLFFNHYFFCSLDLFLMYVWFSIWANFPITYIFSLNNFYLELTWGFQICIHDTKPSSNEIIYGVVYFTYKLLKRIPLSRTKSTEKPYEK